MPSFRISSISERRSYYCNEFSVDRLSSWFSCMPQFLAVDFGTESRISTDIKRIGQMVIFQAPSYPFLLRRLRESAPEDVYYDRNQYDNTARICALISKKGRVSLQAAKGQQLAFDLDSGNVSCPSCKKNKVLVYLVCPSCLDTIKEEVFRLVEHLFVNEGFEDVRMVYSGRGYHIHVFDKRTFSFSLRERRALIKRLYSFPIDGWVTEGNIRLIRLPYSLNGLVSRVATPLSLKELKRFNPRRSTLCLPSFIRNK